MKVKDVMSKKVVKVRPETTFEEIGEIIFGKRFGHKFSSVPVVDEGKKLVGIVTEKDMFRRIFPSMQEFIEEFPNVRDFEAMEERIFELAELKAKDIMSSKPITVPPQMPILRAGSILIVHKVRRLPVIDEEGNLIGVISAGDIFRAVFSHLKKKSGKP